VNEIWRCTLCHEEVDVDEQRKPKPHKAPCGLPCATWNASRDANTKEMHTSICSRCYKPPVEKEPQPKSMRRSVKKEVKRNDVD
jgi:hypothetical protein